MDLPRRLALTTLGDLLGTLHRAHATCILELVTHTPGHVSGASQRHHIHMFRGLIGTVESPLPDRPLALVLRQNGWIQKSDMEWIASERAYFDSRRTAELLLARGTVDQTILRKARRLQLCAKIDSLFQIDDAEIAVLPSKPIPMDSVVIGPMAAADFLHGRARSRDRRRQHQDDMAAMRAKPRVAHRAEQEQLRAGDQSLTHSRVERLSAVKISDEDYNWAATLADAQSETQILRRDAAPYPAPQVSENESIEYATGSSMAEEFLAPEPPQPAISASAPLIETKPMSEEAKLEQAELVLADLRPARGPEVHRDLVTEMAHVFATQRVMLGKPIAKA